VIHRNRVFLVLAFGFVVLGMSLTVPGVAWPSVAETFDRPVAGLGYVTLLFGGGYTVSTFVSGRLSARAGIGPLLLAAAVTAIGALVVLATSATWLIFLVAAGVLGAVGVGAEGGPKRLQSLDGGTRPVHEGKKGEKRARGSRWPNHSRLATCCRATIVRCPPTDSPQTSTDTTRSAPPWSLSAGVAGCRVISSAFRGYNRGLSE